MPSTNTPLPEAGPAPGAAARRPLAQGGVSNLVWPVAALAAVLLYNVAFTPGFFSVEVRDGHLFGSLVDILNRAVPAVVVGIGMTLVLATGGVDLSVGAIMAIAGAVAACLIARPDYSPLAGIDAGGSVPLIMAIALLAALVAGAFNALLVARLGVQPIVATLILMVSGRGVAQLLTNGQIVVFENPPFEFVGNGFLLGLPFPITIAAVVFVVTSALTRGTALGLFVEAVGNNPAASRLCGVNARLVKTLVYVFSGLCAGVAGLIGAANIKGADANNLGQLMELDAILAACIGGTSLSGGRFSLVGTVLGALLIQALTTTILAKGVPPVITLVLKAAVVVAVCLLQSPAFREGLRRRLRWAS